MRHTVTIIGSFQPVPGHDNATGHLDLCEGLAKSLGAWLAESGFEELGFTIVPSFGGGSGWPVERGFTVTFADVADVDEWPAEAIAEWIRARESQEAVCILTRAESFALRYKSDR